MFSDCRISTSGKWILSGEHAVLRGYSAVAFSMPSRHFILHYSALDQAIDASFSGTSTPLLVDSFWLGVDKALALLNLNRQHIRGHFHADNQLPIASGMGASAALCVTLARWCVHQNLLAENKITQFATELEHLYHGQSSGLDIAGVQAHSGIVFNKGQSQPIQSHWHPCWGISYCGESGSTAACINKVSDFHQSHPQKASSIDLQMHKSSLLALEALQCSKSHGLPLLRQAMESACQCFAEWGLLNPSLEQHIQSLKEQGALAVKPTGSGGGGYVISLWQNQAPPNIALLQPTMGHEPREPSTR